MRAYWTLARRMLRERGRLAFALVMALVSAAGVGGGALASLPILDAMVGAGRTPRDMVVEFNAKSPVDVPAGIVERLPDPEGGPEDAAFRKSQFDTVVVVVIVLTVATFIGATANFLHMYLSLTVVERTIARVRREAFGRVIRMPLLALVAGGASDPVSRVVNDPQQLGQGFSALVSKSVSQATRGMALLVVAAIVEWRVMAATLVIGPVIYTFIRRVGKMIRRASRRALEEQAGLYALATQAVQGIRVVKVSGTERLEGARFERVNKAVLRQMLRARTARALSAPVTETLTLITFGTILLVMVKASLVDREISVQQIMLVMGALGGAGASLRPLAGLVNDIQHSSGAAERLVALLEAPGESGLERGKPALARHAESIRFERVRVTYPNAESPALDGVDLTVASGETVAFVGPNGSGKTTLLSLVPRLIDPDAALDSVRGGGRVLIDGRDIKAVSASSLRRQIGVVTQETVLFSGTIEENIRYGVHGVTRAQVVEAAERARAMGFIEEKGGLEAEVGERGLNLSGGQRQRLAIARAILRDPAILILDEATSMIDAESEAEIAKAVAEASAGRTTLVVAHRLSTVVNADRIVVMDSGRVVDAGKHGELLERCELYKRLAEGQLVGV